METEIPQMLQRRAASENETFTFHSSRARLHTVSTEELAKMVDDGERCAVEVSDADVDVIAYACLVALMAQGPGFHSTAEKRLGDAVGEWIPPPHRHERRCFGRRAPSTPSRANRRDRAVHEADHSVVVDYIEHAGIEVVQSVSLEVAHNLSVGRIDPLSLLDRVDDLDLSGVDALVLSACVQCPSLPAIPLAEQRTNLPVISAATATTFRLLEALGLDPVVPGAGRLLTGEVHFARV